MNLTFLLQGPMGIAGPILLILLVLWMAQGERSPRAIQIGRASCRERVFEGV